jgi:glycosyltransferase involved in cell wall biosynthesis
LNNNIKFFATTVIVPVYIGNNLAEVEKCMDSLFGQTYTDFKILLLFDGQLTNDVESYLDSLEQNNEFINSIKIEKNIGLARAINCGIQNTESDFIVRVDADTISKPNRLKHQIKYLMENKSIDVLGTIIEELRDNGEKYYQKMPLDHDECLYEFKFRNPICHPTAIFRRSFFDKAGLYPTNYYKDEDSALWLNGFMNSCIFANLEEALVQSRLDNELLDRRKNFKSIISTFLNKIRITYRLKFGLVGYCFALLRLIIMLSPKSILMKSYLLRNRLWMLILKK